MPARVYTLIVFVNNFLYILITTDFFVTLRTHNLIKTNRNEEKITVDHLSYDFIILVSTRGRGICQKTVSSEKVFEL